MCLHLYGAKSVFKCIFLDRSVMLSTSLVSFIHSFKLLLWLLWLRFSYSLTLLTLKILLLQITMLMLLFFSSLFLSIFQWVICFCCFWFKLVAELCHVNSPLLLVYFVCWLHVHVCRQVKKMLRNVDYFKLSIEKKRETIQSIIDWNKSIFL